MRCRFRWDGSALTVKAKLFLLCLFGAFLIGVVGGATVWQGYSLVRAYAGAQVMEAVRGSIVVLAGGTILAAFLLMAAGYFVARGIVGPAKELVEAIERVAAGDLTAEIRVRSRDEIGRLAEACRTLQQSLRNILGGLREHIGKVAREAEEISASAEEISGGTEQQAGEVQMVVRTTQEMAAVIERVAAGARTAAEAAEESRATAQKGVEVLNQTTRGIAQMNQKMAAVGRDASQVDEIVNVINDIADQTSLLALNAAIEAARVGEHGRGFAVVADQIRKLAERSTRSAKDIAALVAHMRQGITDAMHAARHNVELTRQINQFIREIGEVVQKAAGAARGIAQTAEAGAAQSNEVARAIESIAAVAQQTAASTQNAAAAAQELARIAEEVNGQVSRFKLN